MKNKSQSEKDELRKELLPLTEICPVENCNPDDCPLHELRLMNPRARLRWFNALSEEDLKYLALYHHVCAHVKSRPAGPR